MGKCVSYDSEHIYINNKPQKIMSGAMHYFRIHPDYWQDRLNKLKEMGCNCVETYLCWNLHEKEEGEFDFSGWLDFSKYLKMAQDLGLYAIVRPGPFICSEWDFGGQPWWLLKYTDIKLRCFDKIYLEKITPYLENVCKILKPHLIDNGGNVIFVQIENEYGSYGNDKKYLNWLKDFYISHGIDGQFITSDGETEFLLKNGSVDGVMASVNYRNESKRCIESLKKVCGNQPGAVLELWNGRAQHWKEKFIRRDVNEVAESVESALEYAELVNLYMFHGGTTFGFMNGANDNGKYLEVMMTSYDVDGPLDEYGRRTPKYYAEQKVICDKLGLKIENTAVDTVLKDYGELKLINYGTLTEKDVRKSCSTTAMSMEQYNQGYGYIVYSTNTFVGEKGADITLPEVHDVAHIYLDGKFVKTIERHDLDKTFSIEEKGYHKIEILVENLGRINFGVFLKDYKGLVGDIVLFDREYGLKCMLFNYEVYSIEMKDLADSFNGKKELNAPIFYEYGIEIEEPKDTLLKPIGFERGVAFVNGFNLGRHWTHENSENNLFVPAPILKKGYNRIVVFDVKENGKEKEVRLTDKKEN